MSHRYAPLPNPAHGLPPSQHEREAEMEAAFDGSDDEDDNATESQPLNPRPSSPQHPLIAQQNSRVYNFENVDYDYPPPGSPPPPSAIALPNNIGNSNGFIPTSTPHTPNPSPHRMWLRRAVAAIFPTSISSRIRLTPRRPTGPVGGGTNNDGVFANVTAKPTAPVRVQNGDNDPYVVPEETRQEAPPSYASAQADAVPPYWETTIHAPFAPDSIGDMVIDNLPTGSVFSFLWNLLVSISFQFVGFLLTYLLHTSHAARLGSRAGLGVTLIQYGFALRTRLDTIEETGKGDWDWPDPDGSAHGSDSTSNGTWTTNANATQQQSTVVAVSSTATTEWFSFFLMTIGWFILLTSLLGFWRVKRWEREILASRDSSSVIPPQVTRSHPNFVSHLESNLGLRGMSRIDLLRQGLGFGTRRSDEGVASRPSHAAAQAEDGERDAMLAIRSDDPEQARTVAAALESDARLRRQLVEAGFL